MSQIVAENSSVLPDSLILRQAFGQHRGVDRGIRRLRMTEEEETQLKAQLERLRQEHRDLDAAIEALQAVPGADLIQVQRLKKRKLILRDRITFIEDQLTPDIIA